MKLDEDAIRNLTETIKREIQKKESLVPDNDRQKYLWEGQVYGWKWVLRLLGEEIY